MKASEALREFANWRLQTYARRPRESVRFFRSSLDHSMVWMLVMRGHYDNNPPTVGECQDIARCSRLTTRKLIGDAVAKGLLEVRSAPDFQAMSAPEADRTGGVDTREAVAKLMQALRPREQQVLSLRFGLGGQSRLSLSEVGKVLAVSKERVRQIQDRALEKLRDLATEADLGDALVPGV